MTTDTDSRLAGKLCSLASQKYGESPAGTASAWDRLLLIELAKPWPAEVIESPRFPPGVSEVLDRASERGPEVKMLCMEPDREYSVDGQARVMLFSRPSGPFAVYDKDEFVVPIEQVGPLVEAMIERPETAHRFEEYRQDTADVRDMLVCTHGVYDTCCGSFGYPIYLTLRNQYAGDALRVWRTSHIGGHRFAPNLLDMPEGRNWVRVNPDSLRTLVKKDAPANRLSGLHRGWAGVSAPFEQLVEQEAFMQQGWVWSRLLKSSQVVSSGNGATRVRLDFTDPVGGVSGSYEATVERTKAVVKANCLNAEDDEIDQYAVTKLAVS